MSPQRIQRTRTKGWRMPEGAVYVGRPTRWGNRWRMHSDMGRELLWDAATVTELYRVELAHIDGMPDLWPWTDRETFLGPLRGRDLACWCPLDQPCHADVLLELAN